MVLRMARIQGKCALFHRTFKLRAAEGEIATVGPVWAAQRTLRGYK